MKKGYWVVAFRSISDGSATNAYAPLAVRAVQSFKAHQKALQVFGSGADGDHRIVEGV